MPLKEVIFYCKNCNKYYKKSNVHHIVSTKFSKNKTRQIVMYKFDGSAHEMVRIERVFNQLKLV